MTPQKHRRRRYSNNKKRSIWKRFPRWTRWVIGLTVVFAYVWAFNYFFVSPTGFRWKAIYGDKEYPDGYEIHGIDISHYQGDINWKRLRNATIENTPIRFILIKSTEGANTLDENFNDNFYQAREYGFLRGAYHFFSPGISAKQQAEYFLKQVHLEEGDLPPVLDIETVGNLSTEEVRKAAKTWLEIVEEKYKTKPIIYTNYKFKEQYLNTPEFNKYPYWIAHYYVEKLTYKGRWKFWQYTDLGRLDGIKENVDFNIYNGSMYELKQFSIQGDVTIEE